MRSKDKDTQEQKEQRNFVMPSITAGNGITGGRLGQSKGPRLNKIRIL